MEYYNSIFAGLRPQKTLSVSEWADEYRVLSRVSSSESGRFRTDRTPYLKAIMDALSVRSAYQMVIVEKGSQIGFTELGNNWIGYTIDHDPSPMMVVLPTDDLIKRFVKQRINPMIEDTPALKSKFSTTKKDESNTTSYKSFTGGALVISGANSPTSLRSRPAEKIFADEVDAFPKDSGGEGSPLSLAQARQRTFSRKKTLVGSTPILEGESLIDDLFKSTDQNYYYVPCSCCGHKQKLEFKNLSWDVDTKKVWYECEKNNCKMENWQKTEMLEGGEWVSENPDARSDKRIGFHISALYSPVGWFSWEDIIFCPDEGYLAAVASNNDVKIKAFRNTILGLTFAKKSEVPNNARLWERSRLGDFQYNEPHNDVLFLTAAVDVQADRLEVLIVGWGRRKINWSIDYRVFHGDTTQDEVYSNLDDILREEFIGKNGHAFQVERMAVDTGYNTHQVYNWARLRRRVLAIKGMQKQQEIIGIPKLMDVRKNNRKMKKGVKLYSVGVSAVKQSIYALLKFDQPKDDEKTPDGFFWFLPFGEEFFEMLTAEKMVYEKDKRGYEIIVWEKIRQRNEILDLYVYNRAAAAQFGIDKFKDNDWTKLEHLTGWKPPEKSVNSEVAKPKQKKIYKKIESKPQKKRKKMNFRTPSII